MSRRDSALSNPRRANLSDDADDLLYNTAVLLGEIPKPRPKSHRGRGAISAPRTAFIPAILQSIVTPYRH